MENDVLLKKNFEDIFKVLDPNNAELHKVVSKIPISRHTKRHITAINTSLEYNLKNDSKTVLPAAYPLMNRQISQIFHNWQFYMF